MSTMSPEGRIISVDAPSVVPVGEGFDMTLVVKNVGPDPGELWLELWDVDKDEIIGTRVSQLFNAGESKTAKTALLMMPDVLVWTLEIRAGHVEELQDVIDDRKTITVRTEAAVKPPWWQSAIVVGVPTAILIYLGVSGKLTIKLLT